MPRKGRKLTDRRGYVRVRLELSNFISFFVHFVAELLEDEYMDVYQPGRRQMKWTKFSAAYFRRRELVAGICSISPNFFGRVVLMHLVVIGMPWRRHWPVKFRTIEVSTIRVILLLTRDHSFSELCCSCRSTTHKNLSQTTPSTSVPGRRHIFPLPTFSLRDAD